MRQWARGNLAASSVLGLILIAAAAATLGGVVALRATKIGVDLEAVAPGLGPALESTLPAAVLMLTAVAVNLAAGAIVARTLTGRPFDGPGSALLAGLTGAVLVDTAAMLTLGSIGAFTRQALVVLIGGILAAGLLLHRRGRLAPFVEPSGERGSDQGWGRFPTMALWLVVAIVWGAPVVLQLASPVVPYGDVLPNHVAPVEHLRTFGSFATLTTSPSPIYGPSRIFLGYVATLGTLATLTGLHAALAESAFILPLAVLVAVGAQRAAAGLFGPTAGRWALLTFPLTFTFAQVPDARATVLVFPLAAFALERMVAGSRGAWREAPLRAAPARLFGAALGCAILVHPLVGVLTWLTAAAVAGAAARHRWATQGLVAALVMGLAQAFATLGLGPPAWVGLLPLAAGLAVLVQRHAAAAPPTRALPSSPIRRPSWARSATIAGVAAGLIVAAPFVLPATTVADWALQAGIGLLGLGTIAAAVLVPRAAGWPMVVAALGVSLLVVVAVNVLPGTSLLRESLQFEVPKAVRYWLPWFLATASAGALAATWNRWQRRPAIASLVVAGALVAAAIPLGRGPVTMAAVEERRFAESVSIQLHRAALGYFVGYPNSRTLLDGEQQEIIAALQSEQDAGRLAAGTTVLHIAANFQQWASTPIGVFTGALETSASSNPEASIHTAGGRLFGLDAVPTLLDEGFQYVVLEPADLPPEIRASVVAAGFRPIFANDRGEVFVRG